MVSKYHLIKEGQGKHKKFGSNKWKKTRRKVRQKILR